MTPSAKVAAGFEDGEARFGRGAVYGNIGRFEQDTDSGGDAGSGDA